MRMKELDNKQKKLAFGTPVSKLPVYTEQEFLEQVKSYKKQWMVIEGFVYDVSTFALDHPGGKALILGGIGKDMTEAFNGGVYQHHNSARNLMNTSLRVGRLNPTI
ncbi:stearoyl-CoA 9-desaturase [Coemansia sp. RSA 1200]|nr:stearoyl-CoA 9-desaturase [Coemansia sp. RSA 1200]